MLRDPFVGACIRAARHKKDGAIQRDDEIAAVWWGAEIFESAMNVVRSHDFEEDKKRREEEDRVKGLGNGRGNTWGPPGAQRAVHRPHIPRKP